MAPTYLCRFPGSQLRRPLRLRTVFPSGAGPDFVDDDHSDRPAQGGTSQIGAGAPRGDARGGAAGRGGHDRRRGPFRSPIRPGVIVSGFSPLKSEINPLPLMRKLADAGAALALPVVAGRGKPLIMRAYAFGAGAQFRRLGHPRAQGRRARGRSRHPDRAACRLRPPRQPHRLWRGLLRHDHQPASLPRSPSPRWASPMRPRKSRRSGHGARRPARSCANRA